MESWLLFPEYFSEAISDSVVQTSFLNQINRLLFCGTRGDVDMYAESLKTAPIFSFTLCTQKHF